MENVTEKYIYPVRKFWRFELSHTYNKQKSSFSRVFPTQLEAVAYRDKWLRENNWENLSDRERHELVLNGGKTQKPLDKQPDTPTIARMDSAHVYDQLDRLKNGWLDNRRRISQLEAQLSALIERLCAAERDIDAVKAPGEARRKTAVRAARKKEAADNAAE